MKRIYILNLWLIVLSVFGQTLFTSCTEDEFGADTGAAFRAKLKSLDWGTDTCYVYGHKTPDVDAVTSALSYAKLMKSLGYNCKAKVSSKTNRETEYIAKLFQFKLPELKPSVDPQTRLILTDHTDYAQCVDGANEAIILQKIDHHVEGDILDANIPYVRREMVGSTNTIIFRCYRELPVPIDSEAACIMLAGIISDTRNLTKSTTCRADTAAWQALITQLAISVDSVARINLAMEEAANSYDGMSDVDILESDYKDYDINAHRIGIGSLACKQADMDAFIDRMLAAMPEVMTRKNRDMLFAKIDNLVPNPDPETAKEKPTIQQGIYFIYAGEGAKNIAETIFGTSLREGVTYTTEDLSRKQIVPKIQDLLK